MTPDWLSEWMANHGFALWGAADLRAFDTPRDETGQKFPRAISWAVPMDPRTMAGIQKGPNRAYADEYTRVNQQITDVSAELAGAIKNQGFRSRSLAASHRTDTIHIRGDFPHKTAATRAGIGWIGRHCQLITRPFGPWVRLGTVFTDMAVSCGPPVEKNFCGNCHRCVDACPAAALTGRSWLPGVPRESLLDVRGCDDWKKQHYFQYHQGHNCGICAAVCPYGLKVVKRTPRGANKNPGE
jgi:epoxyqueuosine reductase